MELPLADDGGVVEYYTLGWEKILEVPYDALEKKSANVQKTKSDSKVSTKDKVKVKEDKVEKEVDELTTDNDNWMGEHGES